LKRYLVTFLKFALPLAIIAWLLDSVPAEQYQQFLARPKHNRPQTVAHPRRRRLHPRRVGSVDQPDVLRFRRWWRGGQFAQQQRAGVGVRPVGVPGEIFLGGVGLASGYLNQPELTNEKFVKHPFNPIPETRLYRTGDLGRYLPDGNIEFLGRADFQVKVRGFRIELGEIESLLDSLPTIQTAIVMVREDRPGDRRLVAYVLPEPDITSDDFAPEILKTYLRDHLPEYMLPSTFVLIETLPLTPNGKVDRKALPAPDALIGLSAPYRAPTTTSEQLLADIWSGVIGFQATADRPTIGVNDNFFELGGDSILSIQVIARANQAGMRLTPRQLFEYPTIAELAAVAENYPVEESALASQGQASTLDDQTTQSDSADETLKDRDRFGWSQDDLSDILGAINATFDEDEDS